MGRFPSLLGRFPTLKGRFPAGLKGPFSLLKILGKQPIKKRGMKRFLKESRQICRTFVFRVVETVPGIGPHQKGTFGQHCKSQTHLSNVPANHKNQSHRSIQASSKQNSPASTLVGLTRPLFLDGMQKKVAKKTEHPIRIPSTPSHKKDCTVLSKLCSF